MSSDTTINRRAEDRDRTRGISVRDPETFAALSSPMGLALRALQFGGGETARRFAEITRGRKRSRAGYIRPLL